MYQLDKDTTAKLDFVDANGVPFTIDLSEVLSFSDATLSSDMEKQPSDYAWWSSVAERAKIRLKSAEDALDYIKAKLAKEVRSRGEKLTVSGVQDEVTLASDYQTALSEVRFWEGEVGLLNYVVKAFEQKERMLMQKSAQLRRTLNSEGLK